MALKGVLDSLDGVDESIAKLYTHGADGKYSLEVEGFVPKSRLDEFRNSNVKLMKDMERFKDVDPEKYAAMTEEHRKIQEKEWIEKGELDKVVDHRVSTMRAEFTTKETGYTSKIETQNRQLESLLIDNKVREASIKLGVRATAVDDVLLRAKTLFKIHEGNAVSMDSKGDIKYGKDGTSPMSVGEWVETLKGSAEHLFNGSGGGGAGGGHSGPAGGGANLSSVQKIAAGLANRG